MTCSGRDYLKEDSKTGKDVSPQDAGMKVWSKGKDGLIDANEREDDGS